MNNAIKCTKPLFMIMDTPLHAGSGDDTRAVDLPIQRERHTQYPKIESSSLKGALRESFEAHYEGRHKANKIIALFGPEDAGSMGALTVTDARLLLFPVKSAKGVFAWITCNGVLSRLKADLALTAVTSFPDLPAKNEKALVAQGSNLMLQNRTTSQPHVVLEEFSFETQADTKLTNLATWIADNILDASLDYWKEKIKTDIVVLPDDDFADFVQLSTEVITRIKINNETGTVEDGALFTEEYLPADSVMYSLCSTVREFFDEGSETNKDKKRTFDSAVQTMEEVTTILNHKLNNIFQLGGNATLGKGIIRTKML
jgi:CRISPR-associated protein Cmr4